MIKRIIFEDIQDTREVGKINRFYANSYKEIDTSKKVSLELSLGTYFIDAEWDGGGICKEVSLPMYLLRQEDGKVFYPWVLDYITFEYVCGKEPIDEFDNKVLKKVMFNHCIKYFNELPFLNTYYKNLKINRIAKKVYQND